MPVEETKSNPSSMFGNQRATLLSFVAGLSSELQNSYRQCVLDYLVHTPIDRDNDTISVFPLQRRPNKKPKTQTP